MDEKRQRRREGPFDTVYIAYWSLRDPLLQSQSLPVLRELAGRGRRVGLLTYEQERWRLSPVEAREAREELARQGITWLAAPYHRRPAMVSTLLDIVLGTLRCWRLARAPGVRLFHGRGTVAAAVAGLASRLSGTRFLNDSDGPLSEEYVDAVVWKRGSLAHRLTGWAERKLLATADEVAALTEVRRRQIHAMSGREAVVLPCAVDTAHFRSDPALRAVSRRELGLRGTVLVYAGKAGGWYVTDAMLDFVATAREVLGDLSRLILTTEDPSSFRHPAGRRGIQPVILSANRAEMPRYLSAADAGLSFVLPAPSKAASSPIKNGEYLACGLPVITTEGIGDYSSLVAREKVGVVIARLETASYRRAAEELKELLRDSDTPRRSRAVARQEVGLTEVVIPRYLALYERLIPMENGDSTSSSRSRS